MLQQIEVTEKALARKISPPVQEPQAKVDTVVELDLAELDQVGGGSVMYVF